MCAYVDAVVLWMTSAQLKLNFCGALRGGDNIRFPRTACESASTSSTPPPLFITWVSTSTPMFPWGHTSRRLRQAVLPDCLKFAAYVDAFPDRCFRRSWLHCSYRNLTTVLCYHFTSWTDCSPCLTSLHGSSSRPGNTTMWRRFCKNFTGCGRHSGLCTACLCSLAAVCTA